MRIYKTTENVFNAVDAVVEHGVAAVSGTKTPAVDFCDRIIKALEPYDDIAPATGYENVPNEGYLYFVYDANRFGSGRDEKLLSIVHKVALRG